VQDVMKRKLFTICSAMSLLLCLVTAALWARSDEDWGVVDLTSSDGGMQFSSREFNSQIELRVTRGTAIPGFYWHWGPRPHTNWASIPKDVIGVITNEMEWFDEYYRTPVRQFQFWGFKGYVARYGDDRPSDKCYSLTLPDRAIVAVTLIAPLWWVVALVVRRRRRNAGLYAKCSYDLTGNTSGTCPECGAPIPSSTATPQPRSPRRA
jgi:hypothetical protein